MIQQKKMKNENPGSVDLDLENKRSSRDDMATDPRLQQRSKLLGDV
jgi:hypothetical protein